MNDIIEYVQNADEPVTPAMAADALGIDNREASTYLTRAVKAGHIEKLGRGHYQ